ncbi:hypothetical protein A2U01_0025249, partial [Trifolium medium]|nr:hypothetical protein [Trifolium medium]
MVNDVKEDTSKQYSEAERFVYVPVPAASTVLVKIVDLQKSLVDDVLQTSKPEMPVLVDDMVSPTHQDNLLKDQEE